MPAIVRCLDVFHRCIPVLTILKLAVETGAKSVAFCCLSTGVFRFPQQRAAEIAVKTVKDFLTTNTAIKQVIFNVFKNEDLEIYSRILENGLPVS